MATLLIVVCCLKEHKFSWKMWHVIIKGVEKGYDQHVLHIYEILKKERSADTMVSSTV